MFTSNCVSCCLTHHQTCTQYKLQTIWRFGSVGHVVGHINEVNQCQARLVHGWVTVCRWVNYLGM